MQFTLTSQVVAQWVEQIELQPDNATFKRMKFSIAGGDVRVVAEFLAVVGWRSRGDR